MEPTCMTWWNPPRTNNMRINKNHPGRRHELGSPNAKSTAYSREKRTRHHLLSALELPSLEGRDSNTTFFRPAVGVQ